MTGDKIDRIERQNYLFGLKTPLQVLALIFYNELIRFITYSVQTYLYMMDGWIINK